MRTLPSAAASEARKNVYIKILRSYFLWRSLFIKKFFTDSSSGKKFIKLNSYGFIAKYYCYYFLLFIVHHIDDFLQKLFFMFLLFFFIHTTQIIHFHRISCLKRGICLYVCAPLLWLLWFVQHKKRSSWIKMRNKICLNVLEAVFYVNFQEVTHKCLRFTSLLKFLFFLTWQISWLDLWVMRWDDLFYEFEEGGFFCEF